MNLQNPAIARVRVLYVHPAFVAHIFKEGQQMSLQCLDGIPDEAQIRGVAIEGEYFAFMVEHPSFDPVMAPGQIPPLSYKLKPLAPRTVKGLASSDAGVAALPPQVRAALETENERIDGSE